MARVTDINQFLVRVAALGFMGMFIFSSWAEPQRDRAGQQAGAKMAGRIRDSSMVI